jgi:hypothetical protein
MDNIMSKITPIETLLDWLGKNHYYIGNDLLEKVEELKEVEKQQIILSHINGQSEFDSQSFSDINKKLAEQYYNETFNK